MDPPSRGRVLSVAAPTRTVGTMLRGKPLKRSGPLASSGPLARRTGIKAKSAKRIAEDRPGGPRDQVRQATFDRDNHRCVAAGFTPDVPCLPGIECDEIQGRGRRPGSHLDATATQSLCRICHLLKTDHPWLAGMLGLYGADEWLTRVAELPEHTDARRSLRSALDEWTRRKATALGRPVPANRQPIDGVTALIRARVNQAVVDAQYGDGDGPGPRG